MNRVVITGIGMLTAHGLRIATWKNIKDGVSAAKKFKRDGVEYVGAAIQAGEKISDLSQVFERAIKDALNDAALDTGRLNDCDALSTISVSKPDVSGLGKNCDDIYSRYTSGVQGALAQTGIICDTRVYSAACATGLYSVIRGFDIIKNGERSLCLAGSGEMPFCQLYYHGFRNMGALSNDMEPSKAMRPYAKNRSGFILGEGAAVIVLEEYGAAKRRGADIYAEIAAGCMAFDPNAYIKFEKRSGALEGGLEKIKYLLKGDAGSIYVHSHGTATQSNDVIETAALKSVFGKDAYRLKISSTKPVTGHLLGGSGAIGICACVMAMRDQYAPPTINLDEPDSDCDLDYVPLKGYSHRIDHAIAMSMGFGGHVGVLGLRRV